MTQKPKVSLKFVIPSELKAALESLAIARNISVAALLRLIVTDYIRQKGGQ